MCVLQTCDWLGHLSPLLRIFLIINHWLQSFQGSSLSFSVPCTHWQCCHRCFSCAIPSWHQEATLWGCYVIPHTSPGVKGLTALKTLKSASWARHLQSSASEREVLSLEGRKTRCFVKMEKMVFSFYYEVVVIIVEALKYSGIPPSQLRDNTFSTLVYIIFFCASIFSKK